MTSIFVHSFVRFKNIFVIISKIFYTYRLQHMSNLIQDITIGKIEQIKGFTGRYNIQKNIYSLVYKLVTITYVLSPRF